MLSHEPQNDAETLAPALPDDLIGEAIALLKNAERAGLKLATAESCTGGLLASLLTDVEGISHVFDRGFITYSDQSKCELLGVPSELLGRHGAVSEHVARAMALGALRRSDASIAVAITGFTGEAKGAQPAGLVHLACASDDGYFDHQRYCFGDIGRGPTRIATLRAAIKNLAIFVRHMDNSRGTSPSAKE